MDYLHEGSREETEREVVKTSFFLLFLPLKINTENIMATITKPQPKQETPKSRKRIPVAKIYWKKGIYKELVDDPFNLKR